MPRIPDSGGLPFPPDLCVEVVSPTSRVTDREVKCHEYAAFGVPYYWIIDPDPELKTAEAFMLHDGAYRLVAQGAKNDDVVFPPFDGHGDAATYGPEALTLPLSRLWLR